MVINEYLFKNKDSFLFVLILILIEYDFLIIIYLKKIYLNRKFNFK